MDAMACPTAVRFRKCCRTYAVEKAAEFFAVPNRGSELFLRFVVPVCRTRGKTGNQYSKWPELEKIKRNR